jgi:2',3'-cyclic-nucleotide 2'-phosphodiesterase (5'-nucleotidase family)
MNIHKYRPVLILLCAIFCTAIIISCSESPEPDLRIVVMTTTDVHGYLMPWDYYTDAPDPSYSLLKAASVIDSIRSEEDHTLMLDAGDWLQGNPLAEYFARTDTTGGQYPLLGVMDAMEYDAIVLGNHEFNFGLDYLNSQIGMTSTTVLGGNIYRHQTTEPVYEPYIIKEFGDVKVAVIGLTTPGAAVWDKQHLDGVLDFEDGVEAASRFTEEARDAGAEIVIVLAHSGFTGTTSYSNDGLGMENFGQAVAETVPGIDLMVLGHTHRLTEAEFADGPGGGKVGLIQAGRWASHVGTATINIYRTNGKGLRVEVEETRAIPVEHASVKKELADMIHDQHEAVRSFMNDPVADTPDEWATGNARFEDTPVIDLIQHVQLQETGAQLSSSAAFNTNLTFGPGAITRGNLAMLYPYENTLFVLEVTGKQVREYLEFSARYFEGAENGEPVIAGDWPGYNFDMLAGVDYIMDISRPVGERITSLTYNGLELDGEELFSLAVNSYRAQGGGGYQMLADTRIIREINRPVRALIEDYLTGQGTVRHQDVFKENWSLEY